MSVYTAVSLFSLLAHTVPVKKPQNRITIIVIRQQSIFHSMPLIITLNSHETHLHSRQMLIVTCPPILTTFNASHSYLCFITRATCILEFVLSCSSKWQLNICSLLTKPIPCFRVSSLWFHTGMNLRRAIRESYVIQTSTERCDCFASPTSMVSLDFVYWRFQ